MDPVEVSTEIVENKLVQKYLHRSGTSVIVELYLDTVNLTQLQHTKRCIPSKGTYSAKMDTAVPVQPYLPLLLTFSIHDYYELCKIHVY